MKSQRVKLVLQSFRKAVLTDSQILEMIPGEALAKIKQTDSKPFFQAWSICHEGESTPGVLNGEAKPIKWARAAVQSLKNIVLKGINFFRGHNTDNSTRNRDSIGKIVANGEFEIDGRLNHVVIGYHPPGVRQEAENCDICSQEAEWDLLDYGKYYVAKAVDAISGIALGKSAEEQPAFPGAVKLGMIQAFEEGGNPPENKTPGKGEEEKKMTFEEWKKWGREHNVHPSQYWSLDELKNDMKFHTLFDDLEKVENELKERDKTIEELTGKVTASAKKEQLLTVDARFKDLLNDPLRKMTDLTKAFIQEKYEASKGKLTDEQISEEGLKGFVAGALNDFQFVAKYTPNQPGAIPQGELPSTGNDPTKAANNELLEEDLE